MAGVASAGSNGSASHESRLPETTKATIVGSGDFRFEVVGDWATSASGIEHRDVAGVAVDSRDNVYLFVRTEPKHKVLVYDRAGSFIASWGQDFVARAHGITIVDDFVYLTDMGNHTVRKCTLEGDVVMTLGSVGVASDTGFDPTSRTSLATITHAGPPFNTPAKAAVAPSGEIYVADGYGNARIHRFSVDGVLIDSWGEPGNGPGQFNGPHSLFVHSDGRVFVCDRENNRVQIFSEDGSLVEIWPNIARVSDLYIDGNDIVYCGELHLRKGRISPTGEVIQRDRPSVVSVRDISGKLLTSLGGGPDALAPGNFASAHGLCVDSHGDLYVGEVSATVLSPRVSGREETMYSSDVKTIQKFVRVRETE